MGGTASGGGSLGGKGGERASKLLRENKGVSRMCAGGANRLVDGELLRGDENAWRGVNCSKSGGREVQVRRL